MRGRQRMPTMQAPVASAAAVISATEESRAGAGSGEDSLCVFPQAVAEAQGNTGVAPRLMRCGSGTHGWSAPRGICAGMPCRLRT